MNMLLLFLIDVYTLNIQRHPLPTISGNSKYWKNDLFSSLTTETTAYVLLTYSVKNDRANGLLVLL
ncbi:hypothetical protein DPMN_108737 [Dreissena polymorpha]|uniref:Uncharacterized protein n=1 Tax=Dreissena polymorpha TaxID=45954 RepID=A0A9D4QMB6_DREPO|nr:hypothetical protein DPMN_108728 [Dreissena polymorpha]KAH3835391.1 hypothetical protein DPMN_108737 [Dreissena polymorpha]